MRLDPGAVFAGYTIERMLGHGGMGIVYAARHPRLERLVALKVLSEAVAGDTRARARFEREAALAARLEHANIVPIYDRADSEAEVPWICMKYVGGGDISLLMATRRGPLPPDEAVRLITDAARGLDYAHRYGIIHRDIKPANILIDRAEHDEGRALLTDFGIARAFDDTLTVTSISATFAYAAPERFGSTPADHRADIYSLGCTFYEILTARTPFPRPDQAAVIAAHLSAPPPRPADFNPDLPPALDEVIATALAKSPDDRYPTCTALAEAAHRAIARAPHRTNPRTAQPNSSNNESPTGAASTQSAEPTMVPEQADHTILASSPRTAPTMITPIGIDVNSLPPQPLLPVEQEAATPWPDPQITEPRWNQVHGTAGPTEQETADAAENPLGVWIPAVPRDEVAAPAMWSPEMPSNGDVHADEGSARTRARLSRFSAVLAGLLFIGGGALNLSGLKSPFILVPSFGTSRWVRDPKNIDFALYQGGFYISCLGVTAILIGALSLLPRLRRGFGPALLAGFAPAAIWSTVVLARLAVWMGRNERPVQVGRGFRMIFAGHLAIVLAGLIVALILAFAWRGRLVFALPRNGFAISSAILGVLGFAVVLLVRMSTGYRSYLEDDFTWMTGTAALLAATPLLTSTLSPRRLFTALTVGWAVGALSMSVFFASQSLNVINENLSKGTVGFGFAVPGALAAILFGLIIVNVIEYRRSTPER